VWWDACGDAIVYCVKSRRIGVCHNGKYKIKYKKRGF